MRAAKAYVLGEPFQSHRAANRMVAAVNRYTEGLRAAVGAALEAAEYEADTDADTIIGRGESISVITDQLRAAISRERTESDS